MDDDYPVLTGWAVFTVFMIFLFSFLKAVTKLGSVGAAVKGILFFWGTVIVALFCFGLLILALIIFFKILEFSGGGILSWLDKVHESHEKVVKAIDLMERDGRYAFNAARTCSDLEEKLTTHLKVLEDYQKAEVQHDLKKAQKALMENA